MSTLLRIKTAFPSKPAMAGLLISFALGAGIASCDRYGFRSGKPAEARFAAFGRLQARNIVASWAAGYEAGADALKAMKPVAEAIEVVKKTAADGLAASFRRNVEPEMQRIVAAGKAEAEITAADRAELESSWRAYARGLRGKSP